jgi:hypothetical protein
MSATFNLLTLILTAMELKELFSLIDCKYLMPKVIFLNHKFLAKYLSKLFV